MGTGICAVILLEFSDEFKGIHGPYDEEPNKIYSEKLFSCKNREESKERS